MKTGAPADRSSHASSWRGAVPLLFAGSGCAALVYEIVWFQLLELYVGSSAISLGVLLATFMGGMGIGSLVLPRLIGARLHPMRAYAGLELSIAAFGLLLVAILPLVGGLYVTWSGGAGIGALLFRAAVAAICLLPPTIAMGATLPIVARWVEPTPAGIAWLGLLYAGNIAGGVAGCLLAAFYLLRVHDLTTATVVAAAINCGVAAIAWLFSIRTSAGPSRMPAMQARGADANRESSVMARQAAGPHVAVVYTAIALSGGCALAAEVIWTRLLGLLFGATVYTFAIVLAVFLIGLGLGNAVGSLLARDLRHPHAALGWCQILLVAALAWTAFMLSSALPYWPIIPAVSQNILYNFEFDLAAATWALLPGPVLWGAAFPLALAAAASKASDSSRLVAGVYASNTFGAIAGSLAASLWLVGWIGSQHTQQVLMALSMLAGVLMLAAPADATGAGKRPRFYPVPARARVLAGLVAASASLIFAVPPIPGVLIAYGRNSASWVGHTGDILYVGEGLNASVAVSRLPTGVLAYHNAGKIQASSQPQDMRLQRILGHVTTLVAAQPASVLVIGCGSGVTAGAVSLDARVVRETIVEIERLVPMVVSTYFGEQNFHVVQNPKVRIVIDDGRHYLLTTSERYDAITADPFDPWVKGAASLYTKEFFEAAKAHLNPGGVVTLWVPLYTTTPEAVKSQVATFFDVFPQGFILGNTHAGSGYDLVLVGQRDFAPIAIDGIARLLQQPTLAPVVRSLEEIRIGSPIELFASYAGRAPDLTPWFAGAPINRDANLRLEYLAALGLNRNEPEAIYREILRYRKIPDGVFTGSAQSLAALRSVIERPASSSP